MIAEIHRREVDGLVEVPKLSIRRGDRVRLLAGPFQSRLAIYVGMSPAERIAVLLQVSVANTGLRSPGATLMRCLERAADRCQSAIAGHRRATSPATGRHRADNGLVAGSSLLPGPPPIFFSVDFICFSRFSPALGPQVRE